MTPRGEFHLIYISCSILTAPASSVAKLLYYLNSIIIWHHRPHFISYLPFGKKDRGSFVVWRISFLMWKHVTYHDAEDMDACVVQAQGRFFYTISFLSCCCCCCCCYFPLVPRNIKYRKRDTWQSKRSTIYRHFCAEGGFFRYFGAVVVAAAPKFGVCVYVGNTKKFLPLSHAKNVWATKYYTGCFYKVLFVILAAAVLDALVIAVLQMLRLPLLLSLLL